MLEEVFYENNTWHQEYEYRDQVGNLRVAFRERNDSLIMIQSADYSPFGVQFNDTVYSQQRQYFEYQGHESQSDHGLRRIMMDARCLNPTIGRMDGVDNLATSAPGWSSYRFAFNNPNMYTDPDGNFETSTFTSSYSFEIAGGTFNNGFTDVSFAAASYSVDYYDFGDPEKGKKKDPKPENQFTQALRSSLANQFPTLSTDYSIGLGDFDDSFIPESNLLGIVGTVLTTSGELRYSSRYGLNVWQGQNGKFYSQTRKFFGNQHTGSILKARAAARPLKIGGVALGVLNYRNIFLDYRNNQLSTRQFVAEGVSNTFASFGGIYGVAWGIGWEIGRFITNTDLYQNIKHYHILKSPGGRDGLISTDYD